MKYILVAFAALMMPGCATIIDGTNQDMSINSNPEGAGCELERDGQIIHRVITPQTIEVRKTKDDIIVTCNLEGYHTSREFVKSEIEGATWGNIVAGGGIGWAIDSAAGADNSYSDYVTVTMVPLSEPAPPIPAEMEENPEAIKEDEMDAGDDTTEEESQP